MLKTTRTLLSHSMPRITPLAPWMTVNNSWINDNRKHLTPTRPQAVPEHLAIDRTPRHPCMSMNLAKHALDLFWGLPLSVQVHIVHTSVSLSVRLSLCVWCVCVSLCLCVSVFKNTRTLLSHSMPRITPLAPWMTVDDSWMNDDRGHLTPTRPQAVPEHLAINRTPKHLCISMNLAKHALDLVWGLPISVQVHIVHSNANTFSHP